MRIKKENNNVLKLILGIGFILAFFFVVNPLSKTAMGIYIVFLVVSYLVYVSKDYQDDLIGISKKNLGKSLLFALIFGGGYWLATNFIPGLSISVPLLPQAVSDQMKFFVIVFVAPIIETILFQGALLGYVKNFNPSPKKVWIAIGIQALAFSLFHLGAYISNWYSLPSVIESLSVFGANVSAFISAFLFGLIAGFIVTRNGIKNLIFVIVFHMILNFIIYASLSVVF